jgi:ubiquitin C-terminal hydrolase
MSAPQEAAENEKGVVGILNMGNTCYANSTIQLLKAFPALSAFCLSQESNPTKLDTKEAKVWLAYRDLLNSLWSGHRPAYCRPAGFLAAIHEAVQDTQYDQFATRMPNDAHEYLVFLLDRFQTAVGRALPEATESTDPSTKAWNAAFANDFSPVVSKFFGQLAKSVICSNCSYESKTYEVFNSLKVSPQTPTVTLEKALEQEFHNEEIDEYSCDNCKGRHKASVSHKIQRLPPYLFTVVRRFEGTGRKDHRPVTVSDETLSLQSFTTGDCSEANKPYKLLGIVDHHGSAFGGHYIAQVKHLANNRWYLYDDETAHLLNGPSVGPSAYIMAWSQL